MTLVGSAIAATAKPMAPATSSKYLQMDTCPDSLPEQVGSVIEATGWSGRTVSLWTCRKTHIWISPGTIGTAINLTESAIVHVHQLINMTTDDKQNRDDHDITYESKSGLPLKGLHVRTNGRLGRLCGDRRRLYDDN